MPPRQEANVTERKLGIGVIGCGNAANGAHLYLRSLIRPALGAGLEPTEGGREVGLPLGAHLR
jgi:hypothetical protein